MNELIRKERRGGPCGRPQTGLRRERGIVWLLLIVLLTGPVSADDFSLRKIKAFQVDDDLDSASLLTAVEHSLVYMKTYPKNGYFQFGKRRISVRTMKATLTDLRWRILNYGFSEKLFNYIERHYDFYQANASRVLFTGYYQARLRGSYTKSDRYQYPLYGRPDDLVKVASSKVYGNRNVPDPAKIISARKTIDEKYVPYYSRQQISRDGVIPKKSVLLWCDDPVDIFFLHVQGSGVVTMDNGLNFQVNYADDNGLAYVSIGKLLIEQGKISKEKISMQTIREYLAQHPAEQEEIFNYNPRYIFFRLVDHGPYGVLNVPVTAGRSIATDINIFPKGCLALIETQKPVFDEKRNITGWQNFKRLVLNQDTGSAIKGTDRVDLFCGFGPEAELTAGNLKHHGMLYFLVKK